MAELSGRLDRVFEMQEVLDDLEAEVDGLAAEPAAEPDAEGARSPLLSAQRDVDSAAPRPLLGRL